MKIRLSYTQCNDSGKRTSVVEQVVYQTNPNTDGIKRRITWEQWVSTLSYVTHPSSQAHSDAHHHVGQSNVREEISVKQPPRNCLDFDEEIP